ncbi:MAG: S41 family peptidase [Bacteroidota bacterium]|nr:S41 family peptidase [Bacteroidota bacterium]
MKKILVVVVLMVSLAAHASTESDSLYQLAWRKFNAKEYAVAGDLFEKSIKAGHNWPGTYLNAASSWAQAANKDKTFENLFKMIEAGYTDKQFVVDNFSEFSQYYDSEEWKRWVKMMDAKIAAFRNYSKLADFQKLTKEQMYNDFDTLVNTIVRNSPHLMVRQKVCGLDYETIFRDMRKEIAGYSSSKQFALLIKRALLVCQDGHTSLIQLNPLELLSDGQTMETCAAIAKYEQLFYDNHVWNINLPKLIYDKGNYYTRSEYPYKDGTIPPKSKLIAVQGLSPTNYLSANLDRKGYLSWDFDHRCFYSDWLLQNDIVNDTTLRLTFLVNKKRQNLAVDLSFGDKLKPEILSLKTNRDTAKVNKGGFVTYWKEAKVFYIRIPEMINEDGYAKEIIKHHQDDIEKVVIDVRGNPGGSDNVWMNVLAAISSDTIPIWMKIAYPRSLKGKDMTFVAAENFKELNLVYRLGHWTLDQKNDSSLTFKGPVYVLYDEYTFSAAGSLVSACYYSDKLIAVGHSTGRILGFGSDPVEYRLPNTKIRYRIAPVLDITNCNTYKDIFHDEPELKVPLSLDDKLLLKTNPFTPEFLKNKDPYLKLVLNHKLGA